MATTTTNNGSEVRLREKKVAPSKQNGIGRIDEMKPLSTPPANSTADQTTPNGGETTTTTTTGANSQPSTFEQAFFFGLTIDDALKSSENHLELFYNACKYNHLDLVKRMIEEKSVNVNEPFNNDYPLCIARYVSALFIHSFGLFELRMMIIFFFLSLFLSSTF